MARLAASALLLVGVWAECPDGCPKKCPAQVEIQSDFVREHFDLTKFWGTFYEIALHDSTQPTYPGLTASCQRSVKSPHPNDPKNYKDLFSLRVGPFGGTNAVCDLEFNITDKPGVFMGHWQSTSFFNPNLTDIANTVVDVGVAENGTYTWSLEFQCKENDDPTKGIRFAALNFYHRNPLIDQAEFDSMHERLKAHGLDWITMTSPGLHMVDQKSCVDKQNYPDVDAKPAWCGQKGLAMGVETMVV